MLKKLIYLIRFLFNYPKYVLKKSSIHYSTRIEGGCWITNSRIGKFNYIGPRCIFNRVKMSNYCSIAPHVQIGGMEHSWWWGSTSTRISAQCIDKYDTIIGDDVWIGANAVIKQGIKIGRGSVIGAAAVVLEDIPPYSIAAGIPAKIIRPRFNDSLIKLIEKTRYWELDPKQAKLILSQVPYDNT
jgi:acetyltransferase-like isoleucine patch superfamily enzyme